MKLSAALSTILFLACAAPETPLPPSAEAPVPAASTPTPASAPISTDRTRYVMDEGPFGPETTIATRFKAPPDTTVYIVNCNGAFSPGLQRLVDETWVDVWAAEVNGCLSIPIVVPPGGTHEGTMTVDSGADARVDSRKSERGIGSGTYRAVWYGLYTSFDGNARPFGEELPVEQRVSAPFEIEGPRAFDPSRPSHAQLPTGMNLVGPEHGSVVNRSTPVRIRFDFSAWPAGPAGPPQLFVDRRFVGEAATTTGSDQKPELEYLPRGGWPSGRHDVRVIYRERYGKDHWYAWSFTVTE